MSHYAILPVIDIYANVEGRDLGAVSRQIHAAIDQDIDPAAAADADVTLKGQSATMNSAYAQLLAGLALSIVLIYLVIVVNFQSWLDPFIIITALPAALGGTTWSLFLTDTTLSVPALTGAIMCMGTATANTILVVDFARERSGRTRRCCRRRDRGRLRANPAGSDDGPGHDRRHAADVVQQHAERAARSRGDRRPDCRHGHDLGIRAVRLRHPSPIQATTGDIGMSASGSGRTRFWVVAAMVGLAVAVALAGYGIWSRHASVAQLQQLADDAALPRVQSASPKPGPEEDSLTLPGEAVAWNEAQIYGQVSGYVSQWLKDYGAPVEKGEVLATIDTPGLDALYEASKAQLAAAQAQLNIAELTAKRYNELTPGAAISQQTIDNMNAAAEAQKAQAAAAQQNVSNYEAQIDFKKIRSPFAGIVTARRVNVGDFINAGGADANSQEHGPAPVQYRRRQQVARLRVGTAGVR